MYDLPGSDRPSGASDAVLSHNGTSLLYELHELDHSDDSVPYIERHRSLGVFRTDFATGIVQRLNFSPSQFYADRLGYGASPDNSLVAVAQTWRQVPAGEQISIDHARVTLSTASFSEESPRPLLTVPGGLLEVTDSRPVQWSPDGRYIAMSMVVLGGPPRTLHEGVLIVDADTGTEYDRLLDTTMRGSASWSPDSTRLLVADAHRVVHVYHIATKLFEAIPSFSGSIPDSSQMTALRTLGFAGRESLLMLRVRAGRAILSSMEVSSGDQTALVRWKVDGVGPGPRLEYQCYPVVARMPEDFWLRAVDD